MTNKNWSELVGRCPIDISRIRSYSQDFEANIPSKINTETIIKSKESLFSARGDFNSMVTTLVQNLYNTEFLKTNEDRVLFSWLVDNLGRYLKRLDEEEFTLLVKFDDPNEKESRIGVSRLSSYSKLLTNSADAIIYETLFKSTEQYTLFKGSKNIKKEPRVFLYILFQVLQVTMSILGGLTRERGSLNRKGVVQNTPMNWQSLMTPEGNKFIKDGYKEDTGMELIDFDSELDDDELDDEESQVEADLKKEGGGEVEDSEIMENIEDGGDEEL